jgi:Cathepsin propeptide inhibitor domain (I29)
MKVIILFALIISVVAKIPPKWEAVYTVKGTLFIPYAEIEEPFYGWYDANMGRSRIDYYGGMVKTYQLTKEGQYGTSLKLAPVSTNDFMNKEICLQVNGTSLYSIQVQSILPNVKNFSLVDTVDYNGFKCDRFRYEETIGEKKNVYMLWVRYKKSPKYPASLMPIPVRYDMKGYNTLLGSHIDHYYLMYDSYSHEDIPSEIFEVEMDQCQSFPGPGNAHYATMNPMKEFMFPHTDEHINDEFERFKAKHNKDYIHHEHENRKNIFRQNLRFIYSKNRQNLGYSLGSLRFLFFIFLFFILFFFLFTYLFIYLIQVLTI